MREAYNCVFSAKTNRLRFIRKVILALMIRLVVIFICVLGSNVPVFGNKGRNIFQPEADARE